MIGLLSNNHELAAKGLYRVRKTPILGLITDPNSFFLPSLHPALPPVNHHHPLCCKVMKGDNTALVAASPERFYLPAYVGPRGWVALRLDVGEVDWDEVAELARGGYRLTAPRRLAAMVKLTPAEASYQM
jgi:hypothetical protein